MTGEPGRALDVAAMPVVRSLMFMPGGRADMVAKIPRFAPDVAVVDLEDAVAPADKDAARETAVRAVDALGDTGGTTVLVRVNPPGSDQFVDDVAAAAACAARGIVVPKLRTAAGLARMHAELAAHAWTGAVLVGGLEDALGVADARPLAAGGLSAVYFGAEDYVADLGGRRTEAGLEVLHARSQVVLAAHLAGITAIDQAVVAVRDDERFSRDAADGAALGYQGKICLHPRQVELAHRAFTPTEEEVAHAHAVVAAAAEGVGVVDGQMVDDVHLRMARAVLARAASARAAEEAR